MADESLTISVSRKVNDKNYGHGEVFVAVSGIKVDTTEEEIEEILDMEKIAFPLIRQRVIKRIGELRSEWEEERAVPSRQRTR